MEEERKEEEKWKGKRGPVKGDEGRTSSKINKFIKIPYTRTHTQKQRINRIRRNKKNSKKRHHTIRFKQKENAIKTERTEMSHDKEQRKRENSEGERRTPSKERETNTSRGRMSE